MKTEETLAFCALEKRTWNMLQYLKEKKYNKLEGCIKALHLSMVNLAYGLKTSTKRWTIISKYFKTI